MAATHNVRMKLPCPETMHISLTDGGGGHNPCSEASQDAGLGGFLISSSGAARMDVQWKLVGIP